MNSALELEMEKALNLSFEALTNALLYVLEAEYVEAEDIAKNKATLDYLRSAITVALESAENMG